MKLYRSLRRYAHSVAFASTALIATFGVALVPSAPSYAEQTNNAVNVYVFWGQGCPHCAHAKEVLEPYTAEHDNIGYHTFEVYYSLENQNKMQAVGRILNVDASGVPFIVVGDKTYLGFSDTTGDQIIERLSYCSSHSCPDSVAAIVGASQPASTTNANEGEADKTSEADEEQAQASDVVNLPLIGEITVADFSLPVLTAVFGLLDGFNPCAMWALLFIITLLIGMHDRRRMWLFGVTFIGVSAFIYFVFMAAWLNLFLFIGHIVWIRAAIGLLAVGIGAYYLYDWHEKRTGCAITGNEKRKAVFTKLREVVKEKNVLLAMGGIALLAAAVNIVELACSAGLPVLYTGILSSSGLETWQYYAYMLLYIFFFMLDDLIVFGVAMKTLKVIGIDSKYTRITRFVGGIVMLILGILLLFAPELLMFG